MAEVFGIVSGAIGIAGMFDSCVSCFEYIQLGRNLGRDYQTCQLKLDSARVRLARWGEAANIHQDPRFINPPAAEDKQAALAVSLFEGILHLMADAKRKSDRYKLKNTGTSLDVYNPDELTSNGQRLHNRAITLARRRQKDTSLAKKISWALYDGPNFKSLLEDITELVDELESVFPIEDMCRRLVEIEIEDVTDEPSLTLLQEAAQDTDKVVSEVVTEKLNVIAGRNAAGEVNLDGNAKGKVGNYYSENVAIQGSKINDQTSNYVGKVDAKGSSKFHVGNSYGGSMWD